MEIREEILQDCIKGADSWIDSHIRDGVCPLEQVQDIQNHIRSAAEAMEAEHANVVIIPMEKFVRVGALALLGRHMIVTRMLERGLVHENQIGLVDGKGRKL